MALDGIFIYSIVKELKDSLLNGRVNKVNQPEKDEIILSISNNRKSYKLSISASAVYPKINLTDVSKPNPITPPMFCMLLRKYLNNSIIVDIRQFHTDRIVFIDFKSLDELGFDSIYTLVVEIMGRHSNITLVRKRDNIIMDSIKHVTPEINSFRSLYPGIEFVLPPEANKLNPLEYSYESFKDYIHKNNILLDNKLFSRIFMGVSTQLSKEIWYRLNASGIEVNYDNLNSISEFVNTIFNEIKENNLDFSLYIKDGAFKDFHCLQLTNLENYTKETYNSPSELIQNYYLKKDMEDRLNNKSSSIQKLININLDRCFKKLTILKNTLSECDEKEQFKIYGELLTANIYNIKQGDSEIELLNYYTGENIKIKLKENKSPSQNIQFYYKKYNKLKKSEEAATEQIKITEDEINYLQSVFTNLRNAEDYESIEEIKLELIETGYIRFRKSKNKKHKTSKPMHFVSSEGIDIYVGKNNFQNDYLTLKFANKHDIWLHTKEVPGSHVIVKNFGNVSNKTLEEAANLASYYSKGKDSSKVAVDYTEVRNVHKPNSAKPGMVIYYTNKTIFIDPKQPELERLK